MRVMAPLVPVYDYLGRAFVVALVIACVLAFVERRMAR